MALVTLDQAKTHLHIPLTTTDRDADVQGIADRASGIVVDYLKSRAIAAWTAEDPLPTGGIVVPGPVAAATLLLVGHLDEHRGDDMKTDADLWLAIERLLVRFRESGARMTIGKNRHLVLLQNPGPAAPDGDGGYAQTWTDLVPPTLYVSIEPATARTLERIAAGTVLATATQIVKGAYHPQVTTQTRIIFNGRRLDVTFVGNPGERNVTLELVCVEVVA